MKKTIALALICCLLAGVSGCGVPMPQPKPAEEQVTEKEMTLTLTFWNDEGTAPIEPTERTGLYTGQLVDGVPNGQGKFETQNSAGEPWYYEGAFENGAFHGEGYCYWPESGQKEAGHYENGLFAPTQPEFYASMLENYSRYSFTDAITVSDTTTGMLKTYDGIFPAKTEDAKEQARGLIDAGIEYKHLDKSLSGYLDKLIYFKNQPVLQTEEFNMWGHTVTRMLTMDPMSSKHHYVFYDGQIDIFDGDNITFASLPVAPASYDNVGGGMTNVIVSIASIVVIN